MLEGLLRKNIKVKKISFFDLAGEWDFDVYVSGNKMIFVDKDGDVELLTIDRDYNDITVEHIVSNSIGASHLENDIEFLSDRVKLNKNLDVDNILTTKINEDIEFLADKIQFKKSLIPNENNTLDIGSSDYQIHNVYVQNLYINDAIIKESSGILLKSTFQDHNQLELYREYDGRIGWYNRDTNQWLWYLEEGGTTHILGHLIVGLDLRVSGNDILDSEGNIRISLGDTVSINGSLKANLPIGFGESGVGSKVIIKSDDYTGGILQIGNPTGNESSIAFIPQVSQFGSSPNSAVGYCFVAGVGVWGIGEQNFGIGEKLKTNDWVWRIDYQGNVVQKGSLGILCSQGVGLTIENSNDSASIRLKGIGNSEYYSSISLNDEGGSSGWLIQFRKANDYPENLTFIYSDDATRDIRMRLDTFGNLYVDGDYYTFSSKNLPTLKEVLENPKIAYDYIHKVSCIPSSKDVDLSHLDEKMKAFVLEKAFAKNLSRTTLMNAKLLVYLFRENEKLKEENERLSQEIQQINIKLQELEERISNLENS